LFTAFARESAMGGYTGGHGGNIGATTGGMMLSALSPIPASILFLALAVLAMFFSFGISPLVLGNITKLFKRREKTDEEDDMVNLSTAASKRNFQLNEGVPVEHSRSAVNR